MTLEQPGLLFVAATLLPLASFVLLLLVGGLRWALRPHREEAWASGLYRALGGDVPGPGAAYVALAAIVGAFILSFAGAVMYLTDYAGYEEERHKIAHELAHAGEHGKPDEHAKHDEGQKDAEPTNKSSEEKLWGELQEKDKNFQWRWSGRINWAWIGAAPEKPDRTEPARVLQLGYYIDSLSVVMFVMVTFIASLIHLFSIGYMADERKPEVEDHQVHGEHGHLHRRGRFGRFFLFLSLFCFSMLNLILADNLFQVFVSWELVGVCSYLLIGFYFERQSASNAANKAFITNRIGDAGFIIGLMILWTYVGTFNFQDLFSQVRAPIRDAHGVPFITAGQFVRGNVVGQDDDGAKIALAMNEGSDVLVFPAHGHLHANTFKPTMTKVDGSEAPRIVYNVKDRPQEGAVSSLPYWLLVLAGIGIFLGCVGKSAQFPLHVWLPDAMEGPTPVSALIHAATMVAAGVYLVGRVYPLFTPEVLLVIAYTGAITLFVAATIAVVMTDIKKVLAYSTVSQLGYMMLALGIGGWVAGLFHLVTHAFFKALLFLGSGSVIHGCHHEQEMTKMGGLYPKMKVTAITMLVGVLTIAGTPFFSGWYSKDAIVAHAFGFVWVHPQHGLLLILPLVTAAITTFYMFRMWFMTFTGKPRDEHVYEHAHESPWMMTLPLVLLAICSITVAWGWPAAQESFAEASLLEKTLHHSQHDAVLVQFGYLEGTDSPWLGAVKPTAQHREKAHELHEFGGALALAMVGLGILFAYLMYYSRVLDPEEAKAQFPGIHHFLSRKWYFDELYSAILVRPAVVVANWLRVADQKGIDGAIDATAAATVRVAKWDGKFDLGVVDGLVNLTANAIYGLGGWLRGFQTGSLRNYVLFLVLSAVAIFLILSYLFVSFAVAG